MPKWKQHHSPERIKKMPETKARIVLWGRTCPMLLRMKPINMKKRLTRGNGVAERIISDQGDGRVLSASRGCDHPALPTPVQAACQHPPAGSQAPALREQPASTSSLVDFCPAALHLRGLCSPGDQRQNCTAAASGGHTSSGEAQAMA